MKLLTPILYGSKNVSRARQSAKPTTFSPDSSTRNMYPGTLRYDATILRNRPASTFSPIDSQYLLHKGNNCGTSSIRSRRTLNLFNLLPFNQRQPFFQLLVLHE